MDVRSCIAKALRNAAVFNPEVQVAPACILWPDRERQWEAVIPALLAELPELLVPGDSSPGEAYRPGNLAPLRNCGG